jgi:hypothetical protein
MFKNVIVGVDGKGGGRDAIALATVLREKEGGDLTLGYVYPGEPHPWRGSSSAYEAASTRMLATCWRRRGSRPASRRLSAGGASRRRDAAYTSSPSRSAPTCWRSARRGAGC